MTERSFRHHEVLLAVRYAAVILAPCHLLAIGLEVGTGDVVMDADLGAADAEKNDSAPLVQASAVE